MRRNKFKKALSVALTLSMCAALVGCGSKDNDGNLSTEAGNVAIEQSNDTPLVVGNLQFSGKFSTFFADSTYDRIIADLTGVQILTTDRTGGLILNSIDGETVSYNGTDYTYTGFSDITINYDEAADITTYNMKIRDDVKFSDGHVLDADDIIFTYYVYADPSYVGSTTLYSVPILGIQNYRKNNSNAENTVVSDEEIAAAIAELSDNSKTAIIEQIIIPTLTSEVEWVEGLYGNESYKEYTDKYPEVKDLFAHFYSIDAAYDSTTASDESQVLEDIIAQYGSDYKALATNYAGDETYYDNDVKSIASECLLEEKLSTGGDEVNNIDGIKKLSQTEVEVTVKGFDAAAIYKIAGLVVAPLHYYGDEASYDYDNNRFGFTRGDVSSIMAKTSAPLGAGPYKFVKYENKVVYLEANEYFYKGEPATKYLQFKETTEADKISGVGTGTIDITDPAGSVSAFAEIAGYNSNGQLSGEKINTSTVDNLGYGYVGINSSTVNVGGEKNSEASINLRKAFATLIAVYRDVTIDSYYGEVASVINYPISNTSWAAPQKSDEGYQIAFSKDKAGNDIYTSEMTQDQKYKEALEAAIDYLKAAGYTFDEATGKFTAAPEGAKMEYEVIIAAGGNGDHPTFAILTKVKEDLAKVGITLTINDPSDSNKLWERLDVGTQEMWVAAWSATVDPDMYQTYHSSNSVGLGGSDSNHYQIADATLDQLIMDARQSADQSYRKAIYKSCLDIILDWAVEIPIYQRQNCVIFSEERIDTSTITPDITTFWNWMNDIQNIKMK